MRNDPTIESLSILTKIRDLYESIIHWKYLTFLTFDFTLLFSVIVDIVNYVDCRLWDKRIQYCCVYGNVDTKCKHPYKGQTTKKVSKNIGLLWTAIDINLLISHIKGSWPSPMLY